MDNHNQHSGYTNSLSDNEIEALKAKLLNPDSEIDINDVRQLVSEFEKTQQKLKVNNLVNESEDALVREQYLLNALMDNLPDYIYFKDKESQFVKISGAHAKSFGLSVPNEAIGKTDFDFFSEEHARQAFDDEQEIIRSGKPLMIEEKETWPDRPDTWVSTTKFPLMNLAGNIVGTFGRSMDITKRKQAEEALKESERSLRESQEVAGLGSYAWDLTKGLWTSSSILDRIFGIDESYIRSLEGWLGIVHPDFREVMQNYVVDDILGKQLRFNKEYKIVNQENGEEHWVHGLGKLEFDDNQQPIKLIGTITDITGRKGMEENLRESEEKLRVLFSSMTEMVATYELVFNEKGESVDYVIADCNNAFTVITGIKKEDAIGKLATEVYQTDIALHLDEYAQVAMTGKPYEFTEYLPDIDKYLLVSVISTARNKFSTIVTDVTVIQKIQEEIKDRNKELENYLYIASHDLRSPLVNIQGFSQRFKKQTDIIKDTIGQCRLETEIKQNLDKLTNEDIPKTLNFILSNVTKMETLISGLLQVSRTGRVVMAIKKVNMNHLIKTVIAANNFQITELSAKVVVEDLPECYGDEDLLNQLFSNIIGNALKYRDPNRQLVIEIDSQSKFNKMIYSVKDTGIGIETRHLEKVWDVFYRVDPESEVSGDGIGLNVVKRIVDKHKGKIWVESEVGSGSIFHIELPKNEFVE
jgi:PAS domain S-box-containing protein